MVKLDRFEIIFDNPENAYFAGQEVCGKVIIESSEDKKVNEILLEIKGRAKTYWSKGTGKNRKHCGQSEPYFCEQFNTKYTHKFSIISGTNKHEKERILPKGYHEVPFQYTLPKTLPTSFEGSYGYVRYTCRAICERPWDFDICTKKLFTVIGIEDMNDDSKLTTPMTCQDTCLSPSTTVSKLCCFNNNGQQQIFLELSTDRLGFTPGETLSLKGKIENKGRSVLKHVNISLIQEVLYKAKNFSGSEFEKKECKVILKRNIGEIKGMSTFDLSKSPASDITFLSLPPSLSTCSLIIITYKVVLSISQQSSIYIPITIGTIPLLSEIVTKHIKNTNKIKTNNSIKNSQKKSDVKVTVTDECGITIKTTPTPSRSNEHSEIDESELMLPNNNDDLGGKSLLLANGHGTSTIKKRVRMASSILSEIYPQLPSPFFKESFFGPVNVIDDKEEGYFGDKSFTPKYPVYFDEE
ncbi:Arrestin-like, N-terminal domain and Arrestin C-terminal-like domain and Immunoglobulin E-set domain-containing protein [Strongyloides ratti]|uniref:Arrestin-like, N-terminal domain and Arrestin C-terminal-like domain and Immunoglobulin E-set domain-containing protein n=1 Tax=Strongyloides ratti TaxID=34506 RepID=A0A090MX74_STRRB|nr:Arrestin-like, N-terminal domain and Arrestin C-terminal-like domain and Immunoglobulin E-set domain-containing protein [Strongyloides ratti]CEF64939.1 Arrestin-like, N-terminal domain and Arrestin C-terminal-like domain and Immunoglobulin E-set domain-containing protein [Strongyloides ratti]